MTNDRRDDEGNIARSACERTTISLHMSDSIDVGPRLSGESSCLPTKCSIGAEYGVPRRSRHRQASWHLYDEPYPNRDHRVRDSHYLLTFKSSQHCTPFNLPSNGVIRLDDNSSITIKSNAVFQPQCTPAKMGITDLPGPNDITDLRDPFFASTIVQTYAIAAATILSYTLVIMLLITPRTFFVGGPGGGGGLLGGRGLISGASGRTSVVGIGSRPWLQKVAALTVAISLTIATVDTFKVASEQYDTGFMSATKLRNEVAGGRLIKAVRVISDTFLWLAQVQTLIRLFPRHKEKVIIKWLGSALIICDTIFSILNSFVFVQTHSKNVEAIPTISYLFQLALSLLYAAWILYYAFTKRRYAFYHYKMRNICLVALLALVSVAVPIVFFVLDISNPNLAGWGDYVRWVGAAAASVVVWEWVERIEALERDDRKDGVLGREVFEGDEMLDITPMGDSEWDRRRPRASSGGEGGEVHGHASGRASTGPGWGHTTRAAIRSLRPSRAYTRATTRTTTAPRSNDRGIPIVHGLMSGARAPAPSPPPATISPVSRNDTSSADSTVYAVHHHAVACSTTPVPYTHPTSQSISSRASVTGRSEPQVTSGRRSGAGAGSEPLQEDTTNSSSADRATASRLSGQELSSPSPLPHTPSMRTTFVSTFRPSSTNDRSRSSRRNIKNRLREFAASQSEMLRERANGRDNDVALPVMVIPAPPRGQTWSPDALLASSSGSSQAAPGTPSPLAATTPVSLQGADREVQATATDPVPPSPKVPTPLGQNADLPSRSSPGGVVYHRGTLSISDNHPGRNG